MSAIATTCCTGCSYDLSGIPAPGVCPECGQGFVEHAGDERIASAWHGVRAGETPQAPVPNTVEA